MSAGDPREAELAGALERVRERIARAAAAAGRAPAELTLVVVTKFHPVDDVRRLLRLGAVDLGESREQELRSKREALAGDAAAASARWHFVGRLQGNKARSVGARADLVHSLDRVDLLAPLARGAEATGRVLPCLVQLSLDGDPGRGGLPVAELTDLAERARAWPQLTLAGVMAVAPLGQDPHRAFEPLPKVLEQLRTVYPDAVVVSAGMSGDLEAAVSCGATHLRVGSAVLGPRPPTA